MTRAGRARYGFPRSARLTRASEFRQVKSEGKSFTGKHLVLGVLPSSVSQEVRVGIITSRRVGPAVTRNQVRRRLREIFRLNQFRFTRGLWMVIIARVSAASATYEQLQREVMRLAERACVLTAT
ncbi:MAG TPA: ribonuclease P protein component [Chthoniobacterales bacterium]